MRGCRRLRLSNAPAEQLGCDLAPLRQSQRFWAFGALGSRLCSQQGRRHLHQLQAFLMPRAPRPSSTSLSSLLMDSLPVLDRADPAH